MSEPYIKLTKLVNGKNGIDIQGEWDTREMIDTLQQLARVLEDYETDCYNGCHIYGERDGDAGGEE